MRRAAFFLASLLCLTPPVKAADVRADHAILLESEEELRRMELGQASPEEIRRQEVLVDYLREASSKKLSRLSTHDAAQELMDFTLDRRQREKILLAVEGNADELLEKGFRLLKNRQFEDAEEAFHRAIQLDPANHDRILRHYEALVKDHPQDENAYWQLGYVYYMADQRSKAEQVFRETLRIDPSNALALQGLELIKKPEVSH